MRRLAISYHRILSCNTSLTYPRRYGNSISTNPNEFQYGNPTCGLICSTDVGPFSPFRRGMANNIYVIPLPHILKLNTPMILAAACCIPAMLSIIFVLQRILKTRRATQNHDDLIEGTNGATKIKMRGVNNLARLFLTATEFPLIMAVLLAIRILGGVIFFSHQVTYQTKPFSNVGTYHQSP